MNYKYCPYCGSKIPKETNFCPKCGNQQPSARQVNNVNNRYSQRTNFNGYGSLSSFTKVDTVMMIANGLSLAMQMIYFLQALLEPLSTNDTESMVCFILAAFGAVMSIIDWYQNYHVHISTIGAILGLVGNIIGLLIAIITNSDPTIVLGPIVLIISYYFIYRKAHFE